MITFDSISIGDELPLLRTKKITRTTLALFAGASGDHNPMHIDIDFAKQCGLDDVFAQGMLSMAYLGRLITGWVPQQAIKDLSVRFTSITQLYAEITCQGRVEGKYQKDGKNILTIFIEAKDQNGDVKITGNAEIELT